MSFKLVSQGSILDSGQMAKWGDFLEEGQRGKLELSLRWPLNQDTLNSLKDQLNSAGVEDVMVMQSGKTLTIYWRQGFAWLPVIAAIILGIIILAVLITGWRLFEEVVPEDLKPLVGGTAAILALGIGALVLIYMARKQL